MTTSPLESAVRGVHLGLLWGASLLVPAWKRSEWSQEWRTELWYVLRKCLSETSLDPRSIREATAFCMGAYRDAIWLRKRSWQTQKPVAQIGGSASACLLLLIGILLATWGIAHISPRVAAGMSRIEVHPWRVSDKRAKPCDCAFDFIANRGSLKTTQLFFDGFSHYRVGHETVWARALSRTEWTVAHANSDFFAVLHLPVRSLEPAKRGSDTVPRIVLSHDTWIRDFAGNPNIAGTKLHVGSVDAIVAGVAIGGSMGLPGRANAWLLGSDPQTGTNDPQFVAGHLSPAGYFDDGRWAFSVGGILLTFLVMPFAARPSLGEYSSSSQKPTLARRSHFWAFLIAKITLLLGIVYLASIDLECSFVQPFSHYSGYTQFVSSVALCLLGLYWAFRDQQQRCPICLRRMAHPVEVGQPSRTFLAWNGTELICERGHALLHIPETPTSWFGAQRWLYLDGTWQFLFARPTETSSLS
jgi:hypothetical protein